MEKISEKLIFVVYASTGSGHCIAAKAIANELENKILNAEIRCIDILDYFPQNSSGDKFVSVTSGVLAPIFDITWRKNFTGRILWGGGNLWPSFLYKSFEDYIIQNKPDAIVCTHQVCANVAAKARAKMDKQFKIISVPTDYETEGLWPHKQTDLFCIANKQMESTLLARKVPKQKIVISGIPVLSDFKQRISKSNVLKKFGLPENKKIAIVICGANESGPYKNIRKVINESICMLSKIDWMHFVFCVGNDLNYANKLNRKFKRFSAKNMSIQNYTKDLAMLLKVADIVIIKPGGLAITECACIGKPIILLGKTYAQENINRRYLIAMRAAEHAITYKGLINLLCDIFSDNKKYDKLKNNIKNIGNVKSAGIISDNVIKILNESQINYENNWNCIYFGNKPAHTR